MLLLQEALSNQVNIVSYVLPPSFISSAISRERFRFAANVARHHVH